MEIGLEVVLALLLKVVDAEDCVRRVGQEHLLRELVSLLVCRIGLRSVFNDWEYGWEFELSGSKLACLRHL